MTAIATATILPGTEAETAQAHRDSRPLRLITCGGEYDPEQRTHVDNIVVFARLTATG